MNNTSFDNILNGAGLVQSIISLKSKVEDCVFENLADIIAKKKLQKIQIYKSEDEDLYFYGYAAKQISFGQFYFVLEDESYVKATMKNGRFIIDGPVTGQN
jgi:hypothetical protein